MIFFIVGDPHRGKSVMEYHLRHLLPLTETMRIAAQVDGEGDWTQTLYQGEVDLVTQLRKKGDFTPEFVHWAQQAVANCHSRFGFADLGGRIPSLENEAIIKSARKPAGMIILAASFAEADKWVRLGQKFDLRIIAVLLSSLEPQPEWHRIVTKAEKPWEFEGLVVGLDRSNVSFRSNTLCELATYLLDTVPATTRKKVAMNTLTIEQVAKLIEKTPEEIRLPNRKPEIGLAWRPEELPAVYQALQPFAAAGSAWLIDGRTPQFLAMCIVHALHPSTVALADTKVKGDFVTIGERKDPQGVGSGPLPWHVTENFQDGVLIEYARDEFTIVDVEKLPEIIPPATPQGQPVFLSGKTTNWAVCEIAMTYAHPGTRTVVPAVYLFKPGTGFICTITHSTSHTLGAVIKANPPVPEKNEQ